MHFIHMSSRFSAASPAFAADITHTITDINFLLEKWEITLVLEFKIGKKKLYLTLRCSSYLDKTLQGTDLTVSYVLSPFHTIYARNKKRPKDCALMYAYYSVPEDFRLRYNSISCLIEYQCS